MGGFWLKYSTQLITKNKFEIGSPVVVDENLFCCCVGLKCLCLSSPTLREDKDNMGGHLREEQGFVHS